MKMKFEWEVINFIHGEFDELDERVKVIGGWIFKSSRMHWDNDGNSLSISIVFIPDPEHKWEIEET